MAALGYLDQCLQTGTFHQTSSALWLFLQREDQKTEASTYQLVLTSPSIPKAFLSAESRFLSLPHQVAYGVAATCQLAGFLTLSSSTPSDSFPPPYDKEFK